MGVYVFRWRGFGKERDMGESHVDVLIIGAGVSGIGIACHIKRELPGKSFTILERRASLGGTWDLFRYPGIRSDSDIYTFGYPFRPWSSLRVLADGLSIKQYVRGTGQTRAVCARFACTELTARIFDRQHRAFRRAK